MHTNTWVKVEDCSLEIDLPILAQSCSVHCVWSYQYDEMLKCDEQMNRQMKGHTGLKVEIAIQIIGLNKFLAYFFVTSLAIFE